MVTSLPLNAVGDLTSSQMFVLTGESTSVPPNAATGSIKTAAITSWIPITVHRRRSSNHAHLTHYQKSPHWLRPPSPKLTPTQARVARSLRHRRCRHTALHYNVVSGYTTTGIDADP